MLSRAAIIFWLALSGCSSSGLPAGTTDLAGADLSAVTDGSHAGGCDAACGMGFLCCDARCVNQANDILNCGGCGVTCTGTHPFCEGGTCTMAQAVCNMQKPCGANTFCCGLVCCPSAQLCCEVQGPGPSSGPRCAGVDENHGTCPLGCPLCL